MRSKIIQNKSLFERAVSSGLPTFVLSSRMLTSDFVPSEFNGHWRVWNRLCKRAPIPADQLEAFVAEMGLAGSRPAYIEERYLSSKQVADIVEVRCISMRDVVYMLVYTRICLLILECMACICMCVYMVVCTCICVYDV